MHAQIEPQTIPALSSSLLTWCGSMWSGSSMGSSTVSKPHCLNCLNSFVLLLLNGEVNRKVFNPSLITHARLDYRAQESRPARCRRRGHESVWSTCRRIRETP